MSEWRDSFTAWHREREQRIVRPDATLIEAGERVPAPLERRAPTAATVQVSYSRPGLPQVPAWDAEQAVNLAVLQNSVVWACINALADDVSSCPFRSGATFEDMASNRPQSPLGVLLGPPPGTPNPHWTAEQLWHYATVQWLAMGKFAWELELDKAGRVVRVWPLAAQRLFPVYSDGGDGYFTGFTYKTAAHAREINLPLERVFYAWNPHPLDPREPLSPLQAGRFDVSAAIMADRYDVGFYKNNAQPAGVLVYNPFASEDEEDAFQRQFLSRHVGPDNAGKVAFASREGGAGNVGSDGKGEHSIEWVQIGAAQKDAQHDETYKRHVQGICLALGVPYGRLDASGRTFSNAGVEMQSYWESSVISTQRKLAAQVNMQLAPRLGAEVGWFDTDHIAALRPPTKFQQVSPVELVAANIVSKAEVRIELGLSAELVEQDDDVETDTAGDGGDEQSDVAATKTTVDKQALAAQTLLTTLMSAGVDVAKALPAVLEAVGLPNIPLEIAGPALAAAPPPQIREVIVDTRHVESDAERRARIWRSADAQVRALESTWTRSFRTLFARQEQSVLGLLRGKRGRQMLRGRRDDQGEVVDLPQPDQADNVEPDAVFNRDFWASATADTAEQLLGSVFAVGGARVADQFGVSFDLEAPYAQDFIQSRANQLAGDVTDTTYGAIKDALSEGVQAGEGIDDIASRVQGVFGEASANRATTIARTEVISAFNASHLEVAENLDPGVVGGKEWVATMDSRTRDTHAEADGQVVALDATFTVGGYEMRRPGDSSAPPEETIQCRCTLALLTPEEYAQRRQDRSSTIDLREAIRRLRESAA